MPRFEVPRIKTASMEEGKPVVVEPADTVKFKPHGHVGEATPPKEQSFLRQYYNWLHEPTEPPTGVGDFVNRVMPTSLSKTAVGLAEFPYYAIKQFTDPIINQGIFGRDPVGMLKGLGKAAVNTGKGIMEFYGEPMGVYGQHKANERWLTDPFGSLLAVGSLGEGVHGNYHSAAKGLNPVAEHVLNQKSSVFDRERSLDGVKDVVKPLLNQRGQIEIADTPYGEVKVLVNPTKEAIEGYLKNPMRAGNSKDVLGLYHDAPHGPLKFIDDGQNIYIWDSFESTHKDIEKYYGIAPQAKGEFFTPEQLRYEWRKH